MSNREGDVGIVDDFITLDGREDVWISDDSTGIWWDGELRRKFEINSVWDTESLVGRVENYTLCGPIDYLLVMMALSIKRSFDLVLPRKVGVGDLLKGLIIIFRLIHI